MPLPTQSGNSSYMGRMKKDSNKRWILIQAAHSASKTDPRMKKIHDRIVSRSGESKAVIRVASKIATITGTCSKQEGIPIWVM